MRENRAKNPPKVHCGWFRTGHKCFLSWGDATLKEPRLSPEASPQGSVLHSLNKNIQMPKEGVRCLCQHLLRKLRGMRGLGMGHESIPEMWLW